MFSDSADDARETFDIKLQILVEPLTKLLWSSNLENRNGFAYIEIWVYKKHVIVDMTLTVEGKSGLPTVSLVSRS